MILDAALDKVRSRAFPKKPDPKPEPEAKELPAAVDLERRYQAARRILAPSRKAFAGILTRREAQRFVETRTKTDSLAARRGEDVSAVQLNRTALAALHLGRMTRRRTDEAIVAVWQAQAHADLVAAAAKGDRR